MKERTLKTKLLTILLALIFLGEGITWLKGAAVVLIAVGTFLMIRKKERIIYNSWRRISQVVYWQKKKQPFTRRNIVNRFLRFKGKVK